MSKITLAPDILGTGTFTIAAPDSNSDRTLTLPDNSGTVFTNAGGTMTGALALPAGGLNVGSGQLAVDASGRVTMSAQPSFRAISPSTGNYTTVSGGVIQFNSTAHNVGNHFNTSTYRFTAPITGSYLFCWVGYNNGSSGERINICVNGSTRIGQGSRNGSANDWEQTAVFYMTAGDYADVRSTYGGATIYLAAAHTEFAGFLIG